MALNQFMHPKNRYKDNKPDFTALAEKYPEFAKHVSISLAGNASLDFHDPESLRALTCTLLKEDFGLTIELPLDRLIPTLPLRLNYIHWIEDLLQQSGHFSEIYGIDIGCGASCIYPLLGCQMNEWHYAASELDDLALQYACDNVKRNNLQDHIKVLSAPKDTLIQGVFKAMPQSLYHFTMCNPPFFGNMLEAQGIMSSRMLSRPEPKSVSTASEVEMIYEEGGEVDFVKRMVAESLQLREQIVWYTSMLGKKSSLGPLRDELKKHKIRNFTTTEFCQGRTMRWGIAWTFHNDISVPPPSKRRKCKQRPPLVIAVPDSFVAKAVTSGSTSTNTTKGHAEKVLAAADAVKQMLKDLQISYAVKPSSRKTVKLECTAITNTWANQRRKRRQKRRTQLKEQITTATSTMPEAKNDGSSGVSDRAISGSDSQQMNKNMALLKSVISDSVGPQTVPLVDKSKQGQDDLSSSTTKEHSTIGEGLHNTPGETKNANSLKTNRFEQNPKDIPSSSAAKEPQETEKRIPNTTVESSGDRASEENRSEQNPVSSTADSGHQKTGEGSQKTSLGTKDDVEPLFKCTLFVKIVEESITIELSWLDGSSRESMHQVGQYIKNQITK